MSFFKRIFGQQADPYLSTNDKLFINLIDKAKSSVRYSRYDEACIYYEEAYRIEPNQKRELYKWPMALLSLFEQKKDFGEIADTNLLGQIISKFEELDCPEIADADFHYKWIKAIAEQYNYEYEAEYFETVFRLYSRAIEISPNRADILVSWASDLNMRAHKLNSEELLSESIEKFKAAAAINKTTNTPSLQVLNSHIYWAEALLNLAIQKDDTTLIEEASSVFEQALPLCKHDEELIIYLYTKWIEDISNAVSNMNAIDEVGKYLPIIQRAIDNIPNNTEIYNSGAYAEGIFAKLEKNDLLFQNSYKKFTISSELSPDYPIIYDYWGRTLFSEAEIKDEESLYIDAFNKLEQAYNLGFIEGYFVVYWGYMLLHYAAYHNKLDEYQDKIDWIMSKSNDYDGLQTIAKHVAFIYSDLGDIDKALYWIEIDLQSGYSFDLIKEIEDIPEFKILLDDKRFKELLDKYRPE